MGIENSHSPWLPQNLGLRMTQATFPGTQESKDCGIFWALGITSSLG